MPPCNRCSKKRGRHHDDTRSAVRSVNKDALWQPTSLAFQGLFASSPPQQGRFVSKALRTISNEISERDRVDVADPSESGNPRETDVGCPIGLKSAKLLCTKINTPKLIMQPAANGCAITCHRGLIDDQLHAATDSSGSVPTQNATIIAIVIAAFGAAAAASTNR